MHFFYLETRNQIEWELNGLIFLLKDTGIVIDYKLNMSQQCGTTAKSSVKKSIISKYRKLFTLCWSEYLQALFFSSSTYFNNN